MKEMARRIMRLEGERAHGGLNAEQAEAEAVATAQLTEILNAIAAEKASGDIHGIADRTIAEVLTALGREL